MRLGRGENREEGKDIYHLILNPVLCMRDDRDSVNVTNAASTPAFRGMQNWLRQN